MTAATDERNLPAQRARIREELERLDVELVAWQEHDADRALPLEYRRYPRVPEQARDALRARHDALVTNLARLH